MVNNAYYIPKLSTQYLTSLTFRDLGRDTTLWVYQLWYLKGQNRLSEQHMHLIKGNTSQLERKVKERKSCLKLALQTGWKDRLQRWISSIWYWSSAGVVEHYRPHTTTAGNVWLPWLPKICSSRSILGSRLDLPVARQIQEINWMFSLTGHSSKSSFQPWSSIFTVLASF